MASKRLVRSAARQEGISPVYYFFRDLLGVTEGGGRTAGRKIGVVQEIVVRKILEKSAAINERMLFERHVPGISGATHKVEFVIYALRQRIAPSTAVNIDGLEVRLLGIAEHATLEWRLGQDDAWRRAALRPRSVVSTALAVELAKRNVALLLPFDGKMVSLLDTTDVLASVESKRVGAQIFTGQERLGSGIQTIEKAKQTSLVAIDADLNFNRIIRPIVLRDRVDPEVRRYISVVTLGNGVHWTKNDHNILRTYVDHTYLVSDDVMMNYGTYVRGLAEKGGEPVAAFFMGYFQGMTTAGPDDFEVSSGELSVIEPADDKRTLDSVLADHIAKHNTV